MKKHHIFLLIVALLIVASLAFPTASNDLRQNSTIYNAYNLDEIPGRIVQGDTLYIKKSINPFSDIERVEVAFDILEKVPGKQDIAVPYDRTPILMKGEQDDEPEPYYHVVFAHPGTYVIRFLPSTYYQNKPPYDHTIEVISATNKTEIRRIRDEEDGV